MIWERGFILTSNKELYGKKYILSSRKFQKEQKRIKELADIIMVYKPNNVLDVGCGIGFLVEELRHRGVNAIGIDFADDLKDFWGDKDYLIIADPKDTRYGDKSFDVVVSTDFFEHIPEEEIKPIQDEMLRVGKKVLARIAYYRPLTPRQQQYHVTNKLRSYWEDKLQGVILI